MIWLAAGWGFAEAVLFVIVADVAVSWVAMRSGWRRGAAAALAAALAAAAGGALVHAWGAADPHGAAQAMAALPGVDPALVERAAGEFAAGGFGAMLGGAFSGTPYKLYALAAGAQGAALAPFLLLSVAARLPRFLLAALAAAGAGRLLAPRLSMRARLAGLAGFWTLFYAVYFALMPA